MTRNQVAVFGVLRAADELELDMTQLQVRSHLPWRAVAAAVRELRWRRLVRTRRAGRARFYSLDNRRRAR